ncbi:MULTISPECIES: DUF3077 domain-containing protein [Pseudomonas]|uniref:DUF3077 domain-containing protein n=1 Tax=Pseudomonas TaxID=286 RepID=UPI000C2AE9AE|nr:MULTISPECIES: DUF3077 domain-containing protein [Pseudomonas]PJY96150.1 hypothetical protein COO64_11115 [Pseudomonas donghuensis]UVM66145.1 DUF3077 domain-containing protein [Pseudomonas sp. B21-009]WKY27611.1 DUF3077 domain-containing protein [Pseudomonas donghuensis]
MNASLLIDTVGAATFAKCNSENQPLFRVNAGVSCEEALEQASLLMDCINKLTLMGGMDDNNGALVWAAHYLGEQVKAVIDDVADGLQRAQAGDV